MWKAWEMARQYVAEPEEEIGVIDEGDPDSFEIIRGAEDADFEVKGKNIERLVAMTNFDNEEALYRFQLIWNGSRHSGRADGTHSGHGVQLSEEQVG